MVLLWWKQEPYPAPRLDPARAGHSRGVRRLPRPLAGPLLIVALAVPATAFAQEAAPLSKERYEAIDAVHTAAISLERERVPASAFRAARRACGGLTADDALLGPLRRQCTKSVTAARAGVGFARCSRTPTCIRGAAKLRRAVEQVVTTSRTANRAIEAEVDGTACRRALRASAAQLRAGERTASALRALERALRRDSARELERAMARLEAIRTEDVAAREQRSRFRRACR